jgi:hypothetical protein
MMNRTRARRRRHEEAFAETRPTSAAGEAEDQRGLDGQVGIGNRTAEVDASFSNILSHLHFAAMGLADARRNKFVVLTDALYTDVRGQAATPGPLFSSVSPQQKLFILTPVAGYRDLDRAIAAHRAGERVNLHVVRRDGKHVVAVRLLPRPASFANCNTG